MGFIARIIGVSIATLLMTASTALIIASFFTSLYKAEIVQNSGSVVTEEYTTQVTLDWRSGHATDQFGAEVWDEDKYKDGTDSLMFRRCPSMYKDWKQAYILTVCAAIVSSFTWVLWVASAFLPRRKHKWSLFLAAIVACVTTVGFLTSPAIMFLDMWSERQYCIREFSTRAGGGSSATFNYANDPSWAGFQRKFSPAEDTPSANPSQTTNMAATAEPGGGSSTSTIEDIRFFNILTTQMQNRFLQMTKELQWEVRRDIALGYLGSVSVRQLKQSHTPIMVIAAWIIAMAAAVFGILWLAALTLIKRICGSSRKNDPF